MGLFGELKLAVPWGHIAAKAWGSPKGRPVLCLHGWLDNANSFDRLIPLLPRGAFPCPLIPVPDFYYVATDFGGHGLSSHYGPGLSCHFQNFVSETRRVVEALKWKRFSILGHSFGGMVGGMFSCVFPEMVDELIVLDTVPFAVDTNEVDNLLTYKRKAIEHTLQLDKAAKKPPCVLSLEEALQRVLKANTHVGEECGKILLQRGTTQVATGVVLNRDRRINLPEHCVEFVSGERFVLFTKELQARVLLIKAVQGYYDVRRENDNKKESLVFMVDTLKSVLKERFQYVEVPGNHYVHMQQPDHVARVISSFLESKDGLKALSQGRRDKS